MDKILVYKNKDNDVVLNLIRDNTTRTSPPSLLPYGAGKKVATEILSGAEWATVLRKNDLLIQENNSCYKELYDIYCAHVAWE